MPRPYPGSYASGADSTSASGYRSITLTRVPDAAFLHRLELDFSADPGAVVVALSHDSDGDSKITDAVSVATVQALNSKYGTVLALEGTPFRRGAVNAAGELYALVSTGNSVTTTVRLQYAEIR